MKKRVGRGCELEASVVVPREAPLRRWGPHH